MNGILDSTGSWKQTLVRLAFYFVPKLVTNYLPLSNSSYYLLQSAP